jgi:hypothetical protein
MWFMSTDLTTRSWRHRKPGSVVQRLETWRAISIDSSLNLKFGGQKKTDVNQSSNVTFLCVFILFKPSVDWMLCTYIGEGHLLDSNNQFKCYSFQVSSSQICQEVAFNPISGHSFIQIDTQKLTITDIILNVSRS